MVGAVQPSPKFHPSLHDGVGEVARLRAEWDRRGIKPIGLSVDPVEAHRKWEADIAETQGVTLDFPMIADADRRVSTLCGMIHPESDPTVTVRSVIVIDPAKKIRLILTYPQGTGRNFAEILRAIDSLQLTDARCIATPANWEAGQSVLILLKLSDEEALSPDRRVASQTGMRVVLKRRTRAKGSVSKTAQIYCWNKAIYCTVHSLHPSVAEFQK